MSTAQKEAQKQIALLYDVVILGAGYAGLIAALRLGRPKWGLRIALINVRDQFLERVRLQESIVAAVPPRIPSISAFLAGTTIEFIRGSVASLDADRRRIRITTDTHEREIGFDQAIYALGSNVDVDDVRGAAEHAYRLDAGDGPRSAAALCSRLHQDADRPLRVVAVGGGPTAIEVAGEIKTTWPDAEMTMVSHRCGAFSGARVEKAVRGELVRLGVRLIDDEIVSEVRPTEVITKTGRSVACDICVWSGGMRPPPIARTAGLATDAKGRIWVDPNLRSISHAHILAVGDAAQPIAPTGAPYRPSTLAAGASGAHAADVILARRAKRDLQPFSFSTLAQAVAIGRFGVLFPLDRDDRQVLFVLKGRTARRVRDFLLFVVIYGFKLERRFSGFFYLPGRGRVSWAQANDAMQKFKMAQKSEPAPKAQMAKKPPVAGPSIVRKAQPARNAVSKKKLVK
jgi:NADH:ubiquinone reductase (H+-translocating)